MSGKIQIRLAVLAALAALVAVLVPSGLAAGSHDSTTDPSDASYSGAGVIQLSMDGSANEFIYDDDGDPATAPSETQQINETRCEVSLSPEPTSAATPGQGLVTFQASGFETTDRGAGIFDHGLGVKSGGSQGVGCSRFSGSEILRISFAEGVQAAVAEAQLDIEVKKGAELQLDTYIGSTQQETFYLRSGSSVQEDGSAPIGGDGSITVSTTLEPIANCTNRVDSGPDAGDADNCRWIVRDMKPFNRMELRIKPGNGGEATLEGGVDGTPPAPTANPAYGSDSLFYMLDVLKCGEDVFIGEDGGDLSGTFTLQSVDGEESGDDCFKILLQAEIVTDATIADEIIVFNTGGEGDAIFEATITKLNDLLDSDPTEGQLDAFGLFYNQTGPDFTAAEGFEPLQACLVDSTTGAFVLPDSQTWGYLDGKAIPEEYKDHDEDTLTPDAVFGTEIWHVCGTGDDPGMF